jgi:hypothetical protein
MSPAEFEREPAIGAPDEGDVELSFEEESLKAINEIIVNDRGDGRKEDEAILETEESDEPSEDERPKKKRSTFDKRIKQLHAENKRHQEHIEQLETLNHELQLKAEENSRIAILQYEDALAQKLYATKQLIKQAEEDGDIDLKIDAQTDYSLLKRDKQDLEALKASRGMSEDKRAYTPPPQYERAPKDAEIALEPTLENWLEEHPFMDPRSDHYDKTLSNEVTKYSELLESKFKRAGKGNLIGTDQFYNRLNSYIKENIDGDMEGDIEDSLPEPRPLMKSPSNEVFTPQNSSNPVSRGNSQTHKITLSAEEKAFAESLPMVHPNGRQYTKEELWSAYASHKLKERNK